MKYTLTETVETVGWSDAVSNAPADLVKAAREMAERGETSTFAKVMQSDSQFIWVVLTNNAQGQLTIAKRDSTITNT